MIRIVSTILIALFIYITSFGFSPTGQSQIKIEGIVGASGTLVVGLSTKRGLLVCADKRTYDYLRGDLDAEVKITELTPQAVSTSTGTGTFYDILTDRLTNQQSLRLAFNADEVTRDYFLKNEFNDMKEFWQGLAQALIEQFEKFLYARPYNFWPESGNPPDNALFQLGIFYLDKSKSPAASYIRFCYIKDRTPIIKIYKVDEPKDSFSLVKPMMLGNTAVYNELMSGRDQRFDDIRSDKLISYFLKDRPPVKTVTVETALDFARRFIKLTSERTHLIENSAFHVGPTTDCILLGYKDGLKWLGKNIEYTEPRRNNKTRNSNKPKRP